MRIVVALVFGQLLWAATGVLQAEPPRAVSFSQSDNEVDVFDFVEITATVDGPTAKNPFRDVSLSASIVQDQVVKKIDGFCDSADGRVYRVRFMPALPGRVTATATLCQGEFTATKKFEIGVRSGRRAGPVRVDKEHPWHFVREGTGQHFFWNATTTYWLLGWQDDQVIRQAIDRLARLKINRIRVALTGRTPGGERWDEPLVVHGDKFRFRLNPWLARDPDSVEKPGFDVTRYDVAFWQKCERMLAYARAKDVEVSIIFFLDGRDPGVDPFGKSQAGGDDEQQYYRYGVARLAAFRNVMWDVTNEYHLFRNEAWVEKMGRLLKDLDPYQHLISVHGHGKFAFRTSPWVDFAMYQMWDEAGGHEFMLAQRREQAKTGRPMPQVNEEYGYEDHYPTRWGGGKKAPARSGDNRRRLAWGMALAGCYQTTGERADRGTGRGPDSGGGWVNGRGDNQMTMLLGYGHMVDCFTSLEYWKMEPSDELVSRGAWCLAEPGRQYLIYLPNGGQTKVQLVAGKYRARAFNPRTGDWDNLGDITGPEWTSPQTKDKDDWAISLVRVR